MPFQAPELAVAELDRLHKSLGFRGIEIMTHVAGEDLSAERFRPIFRAHARNWGCWSSCTPDGFTEARRFTDHYFANVIGNPLDTTVAVHHLIFGGVLEDYPRSEARRWRMAAAICRPIRGASTTPPRRGPIPAKCIKEMPTTYLKRLYFDSLVYTHHQLEYLVEQYGADHILMGTDYPADMGEIDPVGFIEGAPGLDDADAPGDPRRQRGAAAGHRGARAIVHDTVERGRRAGTLRYARSAAAMS